MSITRGHQCAATVVLRPGPGRISVRITDAAGGNVSQALNITVDGVSRCPVNMTHEQPQMRQAGATHTHFVDSAMSDMRDSRLPHLNKEPI
jgi:hypothetical protein